MSKVVKEKPETASKDAYLIVLGGDGDVELALVTKEVWDWIMSRKLTKEDQQELDEESSTYDSLTPESLQAALKRRSHGEEELAHVTAGSFQNDKAIYARAADLAVGVRDSIVAYTQWAAKNGYEIKDEYHGVIY